MLESFEHTAFWLGSIMCVLLQSCVLSVVPNKMCVKRCVHCALMCQTLEGMGTSTQHCRLLTLGQSCTDCCQTRWLTKLDKDMKNKLSWLEFRLTLGCVFNSSTLPSVTRAVLLNLQAKPIPDHWSWADDAAMKNSTLGWHLCVWCLCGSHLSPTSAACAQEASEVAKTQTHWFHLLFSEGTHGASRGQTTWKEGRKERRKEGRKEGRKGRKASTEYEKSGNFKAPKTEVISILKNARLQGSTPNPDPGPFLGLHRL